MKCVEVAVGVIVRDNAIFITKRPDNLHQGGKWEFPGGKIEEGESIHSALNRELNEEIGITVVNSEPLVEIQHDYGDKLVKLIVRVVDEFEGVPFGKEGQQGCWAEIENLEQFEFPAANKQIISKLKEYCVGLENSADKP